MHTYGCITRQQHTKTILTHRLQSCGPVQRGQWHLQHFTYLCTERVFHEPLSRLLLDLWVGIFQIPHGSGDNG